MSDREGKRASMTLGIVSPTMTQNATMPPNALCSVRMSPMHLQALYVQQPLRQRDGHQPRPAKTVLHRRLEGVGAAKLRVDDNQAYGPVYDDGEADEQQRAGDEAGVADGVRLADDAGSSATRQLLVLFLRVRTASHDAVGHVHECAAHATPGPRALEVVFGVE
jgi:hypothetical protein